MHALLSGGSSAIAKRCGSLSISNPNHAPATHVRLLFLQALRLDSHAAAALRDGHLASLQSLGSLRQLALLGLRDVSPTGLESVIERQPALQVTAFLPDCVTAACCRAARLQSRSGHSTPVSCRRAELRLQCVHEVLGSVSGRQSCQRIAGNAACRTWR